MADNSLDLFGVPRNEDEDNSSLVHDFMDGCAGLEKAAMQPDGRAFDSVEHETIYVSMASEDHMHWACERFKSNNRCKDVPNIIIETGNDQQIELTWEEARKLCAALWQVTNIAEFG